MCYQTPWRCPGLSDNRGAQLPRPVEPCQFGSRWRGARCRRVAGPGHPQRRHGGGFCHQSPRRRSHRARGSRLYLNTGGTGQLGGGTAGREEGRNAAALNWLIPGARKAREKRCWSEAKATGKCSGALACRVHHLN